MSAQAEAGNVKIVRGLWNDKFLPAATQERRLNPELKQGMFSNVPLTLDQIIEEARHWPPEKVGELVSRLTEDLHASDPETQAAWKTEVDRRVQEIQTGKIKGIPGEEVSARIRKIIGR